MIMILVSTRLTMVTDQTCETRLTMMTDQILLQLKNVILLPDLMPRKEIKIQH